MKKETKTILMRTMMLLVGMMTYVAAWALAEHPHVAYCKENKTLYFVYGDADVIFPWNSDGTARTYTPEGSGEVLKIDDFWSNQAAIPSEGKPTWSSSVLSKGVVTTVVFESSFASMRPTSLHSWFMGFNDLNTIRGSENLNTSEVTTMFGMFQNCSSLTSLDLSFFDTQNVADTRQMFWGCSNLSSIYIGPGWDMSSVTQSTTMFNQCSSIVGQDGTTYKDEFASKDKSRAHAGSGGYLRLYPPFGISRDCNSIALGKRDGRIFNVTLDDRTLYTDGNWNTLCLPFSLPTLSGTPLEGFNIKELDTETVYDGHVTGLDGATLYLNFKDATGIEAGRPYIVKKLQLKDDAGRPVCTATSGTTGSLSTQNYPNLVDEATGAGHVWRTDISAGNPSFCEFNSDTPAIVTGYTLTTGNQATSGDPIVWTLQAKRNEDDAWTTIDSRNVTSTPADALPGGRTAGKSYTVQNPGLYKYFRFEVTQTGGNYMCLSELTLQAYFPSDAVDIEEPTFATVTIDASAPQSVTSQDGKVTFKGVYDYLFISGEDRSILYLGSSNTLYWPSRATYIWSCRAYFQLSGIDDSSEAPFRRFVLNFLDEQNDEDETTNIIATEDVESRMRDGVWYTLDGRRLSGKPTARGIYVNNGRKVVIK